MFWKMAWILKTQKKIKQKKGQALAIATYTCVIASRPQMPRPTNPHAPNHWKSKCQPKKPTARGINGTPNAKTARQPQPYATHQLHQSGKPWPLRSNHATYATRLLIPTPTTKSPQSPLNLTMARIPNHHSHTKYMLGACIPQVTAVNGLYVYKLQTLESCQSRGTGSVFHVLPLQKWIKKSWSGKRTVAIWEPQTSIETKMDLKRPKKMEKKWKKNGFVQKK